MVMWELSIVVDTAARYPLGCVEESGLEALVSEAQRRIAAGEYPHPHWKVGAILIQRADATVEARQRAWEEAFFDVDRAGRKRRRYKRPDIEKQWEAWAKAERAALRDASKQRNAERG